MFSQKSLNTIYKHVPVYLRKVIQRHKLSLLFLFFTWFLYFAVMFSGMLGWEPDGLWAGHVHVWGDWSLHISMANTFAYKDPSDWFAYHPYYSGGKFTYGFLTNLISGLLIRAGFPFVLSFLVPSIIFSFFLIFGLYAFFYLVLRSQKSSIVALTIFFCSSGLGFLRFLPDWLANPTLSHLLFPLKNYTALDQQYQWLAGNFVNAMFVPQRAFLLGMTISIWVIVGVFWVLVRKQQLNKKNLQLSKNEKTILVLCGVGAGILPITHMHSFIVLVILSGFWTLLHLRLWKQLLWYAVPAGVLSTILYLIFVKGGIENPKFMQILIGWTAPLGKNQLEHLLYWFKMWWDIWGVMLPTAVLAIPVAWVKLPRLNRVTLYVGFVIFLLGNIILFQPIQWDNSKLFLWAYLFFSGLAALFIQQLWRKRVEGKVIAICLFILLTATGMLELSKLLQFKKQSYRISSNAEIALGEYVRKNTHPHSVFLIAPTHNHPVMQWGVRPITLGYTAWAWNFGFLYHERERDIITIYQGGPQTLELLKKYNISYVSIGPEELNRLHASEAYFKRSFPLFAQTDDIRIYDVRSVTHGP